MNILKQTVQAVFRAVFAIFLSVPVSGAIAFLVVEGVGSAVTHQFPGSLLTHLLAVAFALAVAYASALTLAVLESARGIIAINDAIRHDFARESSVIGRAVKGLEERVLKR
jgi:hypothetical protein